MLTEIIAKRTYTQKTFQKDDGKFVLHAHVGHIHYKDDQGFFRDSDFELEDMGSYWRMEKANYRLYIAKNFGASQLIRFENHYEGANHTIYFEPHSLWWVDRTNPSNRTLFRNAQAVQGTVDTQNNKIIWKDAFGKDIDYELQIRRSGFAKEIVVKNKAALGTPPSANHDLVILCKYTGAGLRVRANDLGAYWDNSSRYESAEGFQIKEAIEAFKSFVLPAYATDSQVPNVRRIKIKVFWELRNSILWQAKVIPLNALNLATYPIRADTTINYYTSAGDGWVKSDSQDTWDIAHDAASGVSDYVSDVALCGTNFDSTYYNIHRAFFPVDTSGLPDDCTISAAVLHAIVGAVYDNDNDGDDWVNIVGPTTQASPTALQNDDYIDCGAINNPTEGATRIDIGDLVAYDWNSWTLNSTGRGWISKTGYTPLGLREGHDCIDSAVTGRNTIQIFTSEQAETELDPYLEVVYTTGGYTLSVDPGSYTLTGQAVSSLHNKLLGIGAGAYSLSGQDAGLLYGRLISIGAGSYLLTGQGVDLLHNKLISIGAGAYLLTGQDVGTLYGRLVSAGAGSYLITGQDAGLLHNKIISIAAGVYALTGQDVTLTYISGYVLNAEAGSYTLAGQAANLLKAHNLSLDAGVYILTGQDASALLGRLISAQGGSYGISGQVADLLRAGKISIGSGAYLLIGTNAGLTYSGIQVFPIIFDVIARQRIFDSEDRDRISDVEARDRIFDVKRRDN